MQKHQRSLLGTLEKKILEKRKFIQVVAGPRQVGKTTLVNQLVAKNLIFSESYAVDGVLNSDGTWINAIWEKMRADMRERGEVDGLLVIDEIQKISNWSEYVKMNWDIDSKNGLNLKLIILGSSRLLLQQGLSESLFGRFEMNYLGHWSFAEMHEAFDIDEEQYIWFGGYPGAVDLISDEARFKSYIANAVIESTLNRDILVLTNIRKPALLSRLLELGSAYSSQILSYNKILGQLNEKGNTSTLAYYVKLLDQSGLVAGLDAYSKKLLKIRASSPKFQVYDTALISASNQMMSFAEAKSDTDYWGRMVESAIGAHLLSLVASNPTVKIFYWREDDNEVDFVLKSGDKIVGIEVKSGVENRIPTGLRSFSKTFSSARTILVGADGMDYRKFLRLSLEQIFDR